MLVEQTTLIGGYSRPSENIRPLSRLCPHQQRPPKPVTSWDCPFVSSFTKNGKTVKRLVHDQNP